MTWAVSARLAITALMVQAAFVYVAVGLGHASAGDLVDQAWEGTPASPFRSWGSDAITETNLPLGQEFVPSAPDIDGAELCLTKYQPDPATITVRVRTGTITGAIVSSTEERLDGVFHKWVHFDLPPSNLAVGEKYVLEVTGEVTAVGWDFTDVGDGYVPGQSIQNGTLRNDDFLFRTFTSSGTGNQPSTNPCVPPNQLDLTPSPVSPSPPVGSPTASGAPSSSPSPAALPPSGGPPADSLSLQLALLSVVIGAAGASLGYLLARR